MGEYPSMNALWSFYYAAAGSLYFGHSDNRNFVAENIKDPKLQTLIKKVKLDDLDKDEGIELEVRMKNGEVYIEYVARALGEPYRPLSQEKLVEKFMKQVEFSKLVNIADAKKLVEMLEDLENVANINDILGLAVKR